MAHEFEAFDFAGTGYVDTRSLTIVECIPDGDVIVIHVSNRKVFVDHRLHLFLQLFDVELGRGIWEIHGKSVFYVIMSAAGKIVRIQAHFTEILGGVSHQTVRKRRNNEIFNL